MPGLSKLVSCVGLQTPWEWCALLGSCCNAIELLWYSQELQPWFKWLLYDALFTLAVQWLGGRSRPAARVFTAVGWLGA
jgi:hypothetical protein